MEKFLSMSPFFKKPSSTLISAKDWTHGSTQERQGLYLWITSQLPPFTTVFMPIQPHRKNDQICPECLHTTHRAYRRTSVTLIRNSWQGLEMDSYGKRKVLLSFTESYLFKKNSTGLARLGRVGRLISKSLSCFKDQIGKTTSCPPWSGIENPWHLKKCVKDCVFSLSLELLQ